MQQQPEENPGPGEKPDEKQGPWNRIHIGVLIWLVVMILLMGIFTEIFK